VSITNQNFESQGAQTLTTTSTIDVRTVQLAALASDTTFTAASVLSVPSVNYGFWDAQLVLTGGTTTVAVNSDLEAGSIIVENSAVLDDDGGIVRGGSGLASTTLTTGGTLEGDGDLGNLTNASGIVSPGDATPRTLGVAGNYIQDAAGTLAERLASGSNFGILQINGSATLDGALSLTNVGFAPQPGEEWVILTSGAARTGTFRR
jgi:hypothetical protein